MLRGLIASEQLQIVLGEIQEEIRVNGTSPKEKALLFHQLGSVQGLLGNHQEQWAAWQQASELDPDSEMIRLSLQSLLG